jgi:hypothetical protein
MISVILVQHNRGDLTCACIDSLLRFRPTGYEIIVIDNASTDGSGEMVRRRFESVQCIQQANNIGFGAANNAGARAAGGDLLFFLNNDTFALSDPLTPLGEYMQAHPGCGAAGIALRNPDGSPQSSLGRWPLIRTEWLMKRGRGLYDPAEYASVDWLTGAALCVRREVFESVGGFDEGFFMYFEDVDLCRRIADAGSARHFIPSIEMVHVGGASQSAGLRPAMQLAYRRAQRRYYAQHASPLQQQLLRLYLGLKAAGGIVFGSCERRSTALGILRLLKEK